MEEILGGGYTHCFAVGTPFADVFVVGKAVVELGLAMYCTRFVVQVVIVNILGLQYFETISNLVYTKLRLADFLFELSMS